MKLPALGCILVSVSVFIDVIVVIVVLNCVLLVLLTLFIFIFIFSVKFPEILSLEIAVASSKAMHLCTKFTADRNLGKFTVCWSHRLGS